MLTVQDFHKHCYISYLNVVCWGFMFNLDPKRKKKDDMENLFFFLLEAGYSSNIKFVDLCRNRAMNDEIKKLKED